MDTKERETFIMGDDTGLRVADIRVGSRLRNAVPNGHVPVGTCVTVLSVEQPNQYSFEFAPVITVKRDDGLTRPAYVHHYQLVERLPGEDPNGY